mgnify:CR=1 FL=1
MLSAIAVVSTPIVGVIYWVSKLEGRLEAQREAHDRHVLLQNQRHEDLRDDIQYIRDRIDRALVSR